MVSQTSGKVYHEEIKGVKEDSQAEIVFKAIVRIGRACTMREIKDKCGLEINVVSRSLNNLRVKENRIEYFDADATVNGKTRRVHHYMVKSKPGKQAEINF